MLHTLAHSPWYCDIGTLLQILCKGDDLLLLQDGVLASIKNNRFIEVFKNIPIMISVLKEDLEARGLIDKTSTNIAIISYNDFVNLTIKHASQMTW